MINYEFECPKCKKRSTRRMPMAELEIFNPFCDKCPSGTRLKRVIVAPNVIIKAKDRADS